MCGKKTTQRAAAAPQRNASSVNEPRGFTSDSCLSIMFSTAASAARSQTVVDEGCFEVTVHCRHFKVTICALDRSMVNYISRPKLFCSLCDLDR